MVKLQIASDLHIEFSHEEKINPLTYIKPSAPYLILTGDIGSLYRYNQLTFFLKGLSCHFRHIFYILGNNEFYFRNNYKPKTPEELYKSAYNLEELISNLTILENKMVKLENIFLIGSTLWSDITYLPKNYKIKYFTKEKYNQLNIKSKKSILELLEIANNYNIDRTDKNLEKLKIVVATHYPPIEELSQYKKYKKDMYINDMYTFLEWANIWIYGHVHNNKDILSYNCRVVGNQYGKPGKYCPNYHTNFVIDTDENR